MLEAALKLEKVFEGLEMMYNMYVGELGKGKGLSTFLDWEYARTIMSFLKIFYEATFLVPTYVINNMYMSEVFTIERKIKPIQGGKHKGNGLNLKGCRRNMISTAEILKFEFVVVNCVCVRSYK